MIPSYDDFLIKRFEQPDEVRTFEKGYFEIVKIGSMTIGRASYEPGWKWSKHVGLAAGAASCEVEHIGLVVSGSAACQMNDGRYYEMKAGDLFYIGPGHDSPGWWAISPTFRSIFLAPTITPAPRQVERVSRLGQKLVWKPCKAWCYTLLPHFEKFSSAQR